MSYAPGVVDISGQLRAQGIVAAGNNIASGLNEGLANYGKLKAADAATTGQIEGYGAAGINALIPFLTPDGQKNAQLFLSHKADLNDKTMLLGALTQAKALKESADKSSLQQQQMELQKQQLAQNQFLMQQDQQRAQQNAAMNARLGQMATLGNQVNRGEGLGVLTPDAVQRAKDFISSPLGQMTNMGATITPAMMQDLIEKTQLGKAGNAVDPVSFRGTTPDGAPTEITVDRRTGKQISSGPVNQPPRAYPTPEEAGATELAKTSASETAKIDTPFLNGVASAAADAQEAKTRIASAQQLLAAGASAGWGQAALNQVTGAATRLGVWDSSKQANAEQLQMALSRDALDKAKELYKSQGSVTENERKRIDTISTDIGKTPEANLAALKMADAIATRSLAAEQLRRKSYDAGDPPKVTAEKIRRFVTDNPLPAFSAIKNAPAAPTAPALKLPPGVKILN